jgi:hypothetical protein
MNIQKCNSASQAEASAVGTEPALFKSKNKKNKYSLPLMALDHKK